MLLEKKKQAIFDYINGYFDAIDARWPTQLW